MGNGVRIDYKFVPMRVIEKSGASLDMVFTVENEQEKPALISIELEVPKNALIGFDSTTSKKRYEVKLRLEPYEKKVFYVTVYTTNQTPAYDYPLRYTIYYHVDDFDKVVDKVVRMAKVKVV